VELLLSVMMLLTKEMKSSTDSVGNRWKCSLPPVPPFFLEKYVTLERVPPMSMAISSTSSTYSRVREVERQS